jgi:class 3 adenylate cyclase/tetratricopeptide (TPR) repeat protein/ABC-type transport system involved in cytochrome c biogenesis ATPase subunit
MQQIADWLEELGMSEYAHRFADNDIDASVLRELTDQDLKDLGVSLGHRRKMLRAIRDLGSAPVSVTAPTTPVATEQTRQDSAERRQLTVMFCDLVGSTALSRRLDPEDLGEVIRGYQDAMSGVVARHGGYVANFLGDGIIAYFGWPRADEDEAAQAIRAGLEAAETARRLPCGNGDPLQVRVGIASGNVVVGDVETAGRRQPGAIAGDTPNLAARLQALADADQVVIDELTRQLVGAGFIFEELSPRVLKGFAAPVRASRVLAERTTQSRFEVREGRLTPFIGREHETALLVERFQRAAAGEGQAVLLSGEAGIGKSRLVQTLSQRLAATPHTRIQMQCSPFHTTSTLHPIIRHLEYAAGFRPEDGPGERLRKLEALLRQAANDPADGLAALGPLLSLPASDRHASVELTAEQRQIRALKALVDQLLGLAAQKPVLFILEDAHWIDPATRELITHTLARLSDARMLMVITHRPDLQTDWTRHPQVTALTLNRLSRGQGAEIARAAAAAAAALPEETVTRILRRADGVPLFIEELTRSVVETGGAFGDSGVPETLQASLLARLDRLGPEVKEVAQIAAVIGREFGSELLGVVAGKSKEALAAALERLVASEIALPTGAAQGGVYLFRHALIQDAAYQSLLVSRRRQYHSEIARVLESRFPDVVAGQPELIAQHYTAAAAPEQAIPYWVRAGERALARSVYLEPLAHFEQALQLARGLSESAESSRRILNLVLLVGEARLRVQSLQEALHSFREAAERARILGAPADLARAALGAEETEVFLGIPVHGSADLLEAALAALKEGDSTLRCRVLSHLGRVSFKLGAFDRASALMREATELARRLGDRRALFEALDCAHIATTRQPWVAAQFPQLRATIDEMIAIAEEIGDRPELILRSLAFAMVAGLEMGDLAAFEAHFAKSCAMAEKGQVESRWMHSSIDALRAILHGDFATAERMAEGALHVPGDVHDEVVTGVYGMQMFTIRREQGRLAEVAPLVKRFVAEKSQDAVWRPGLALIASDLGFAQAAQKTFGAIAAEGFPVPTDAKRNITLCYLAEVCTRLADGDRAEQLRELLTPYRDLAVVVPVTTICCGSNARYLGMLATVMGDWATAEKDFEAALAMDERLQAWPWLAHTKHEFALMLRERSRASDRERGDTLLAEASASAERFGMAALQARIRSLAAQS